MKYGTYTIAREYDDRGKIDEWMQLFLKNDGHNLELADGLLRQERRYIGIRRIPLSLLAEIRSGARSIFMTRIPLIIFSRWWIR